MATSWPLPPWFLTGKRSVWCFLFVTLFNLQGTRRFRRNIAIIHDFIPFVKNFFWKFLTFFPVRRCTQQLFYCITLSSVCQEVFQLFSFARLPLISDNFCIVTHCLVLVNSFLNFFKFLLAAPRISRTAWLEYQTLSLDSFALCIVLPLFQMPRNRFFSLLLYHLYWFCSPKLSSSHSVL